MAMSASPKMRKLSSEMPGGAEGDLFETAEPFEINIIEIAPAEESSASDEEEAPLELFIDVERFVNTLKHENMKTYSHAV